MRTFLNYKASYKHLMKPGSMAIFLKHVISPDVTQVSGRQLILLSFSHKKNKTDKALIMKALIRNIRFTSNFTAEMEEFYSMSLSQDLIRPP